MWEQELQTRKLNGKNGEIGVFKWKYLGAANSTKFHLKLAVKAADFEFSLISAALTRDLHFLYKNETAKAYP